MDFEERDERERALESRQQDTHKRLATQARRGCCCHNRHTKQSRRGGTNVLLAHRQEQRSAATEQQLQGTCTPKTSSQGWRRRRAHSLPLPLRRWWDRAISPHVISAPWSFITLLLPRKRKKCSAAKHSCVIVAMGTDRQEPGGSASANNVHATRRGGRRFEGIFACLLSREEATQAFSSGSCAKHGGIFSSKLSTQARTMDERPRKQEMDGAASVSRIRRTFVQVLLIAPNFRPLSSIV